MKTGNKDVNIFDFHRIKILKDNVRNPLKALFLSNTTADESEKILRNEYGFTNKQIEALKKN